MQNHCEMRMSKFRPHSKRVFTRKWCTIYLTLSYHAPPSFHEANRFLRLLQLQETCNPVVPALRSMRGWAASTKRSATPTCKVECVVRNFKRAPPIVQKRWQGEREWNHYEMHALNHILAHSYIYSRISTLSGRCANRPFSDQADNALPCSVVDISLSRCWRAQSNTRFYNRRLWDILVHASNFDRILAGVMFSSSLCARSGKESEPTFFEGVFHWAATQISPNHCFWSIRMEVQSHDEESSGPRQRFIIEPPHVGVPRKAL